MGLFDKIMDDWLGDPFGSYHQAEQGRIAGETQAQRAQEGIDEMRRQYDIGQAKLEPFVEAGRRTLPFYESLATPGLRQTENLGRFADVGASSLPMLERTRDLGAEAQNKLAILSGLGTPEEQAAVVAEIESSPIFQERVRQGEEAILSNASATGGLRGGDTKAALAQFRPQILAEEIERRYGRLGGLSDVGVNVGQYLAGSGGNVAQGLFGTTASTTSDLARMGQASAAGQASAGQNLGVGVADLLGQKGAAQAGGMMSAASGRGSGFGDALGLFGMYSGLGGIKGIKGLF